MFNLRKFQTNIKDNGVLHGNRFIVVMPVLQAMNNVDSNYGEKLTLSAEAISAPGMSLASADGLPPRYGYGPVEGRPYGVLFDPVTITFMIDGHGSVYKYFYEWTNLIVNYRSRGQSMAIKNSTNNAAPYEVSYKDDYCKDIFVYVLEPHHDSTKVTTEHVMKYTFFRAYPRALPQLNLAWRQQNEYLRLPITFDYTDFIVEFDKKQNH
jgi:hypothetical protein